MYIHSKTIWSFRVSHKIGPRFEQVKGFLTQNFVTVKVRNFWNEYLGILVHPILHCSIHSCILSCIVRHTRASYPALFDILEHPILHCSTHSCILSCMFSVMHTVLPAHATSKSKIYTVLMSKHSRLLHFRMETVQICIQTGFIGVPETGFI